MPYRFKPDTGYFMPANFGPLSSQRVGHYSSVTQLTILYSTDKDALGALLPEPFQPADDPVVTVYCQVFKGVDFLAGGGYNVVGVNLAAVFDGKKDHLAGGYAAVLWENDTVPIITGRELLGAPKHYADIPDPQHQDNDWRFHCSVYGTRLIEGEVKNAAPVDEATVRQIEEIARGNSWMGWKYIPKADWSGPELSFPTVIPARPSIDQAWMGEGAHRFLEVTWERALYNKQIMEGLRTLVVKEHRAAVVTKGTLELLVGESRKIE